MNSLPHASDWEKGSCGNNFLNLHG